MRILVVEDDAVLMNGLQVGLGQVGFTVDAVATRADASAALHGSTFDAVVLDLMLPDGSGLEVLGEMRARRVDTPVLLLTARDGVPDRIAGLDAGADDYLGKPFDLDEVAARLRALTRRATGRATASLSWNDLHLEPAAMALHKAGAPVRLSRREFSILHALMERPGQILSKLQLEDRLYGWQEDVESNTIEVHIHNLRAKLGAGVIETVRGVGYRLAEHDA
ncbi:MULTISPECIES: response regulator [unclassified Chelatococcus]|uniref:response regulator n=1 Tax=unclassified Chelatococcus TaxID=2638111 RepID=UPI001BCFE607|nr:MULTISPECIES: response regulator [unclassified Chelatococcus]MBS7700079.1 winged helix-turn-helix domain-containing protein [Chelatococcus sp. YT9]MBX3556772.1 winged helix-turn-helix domain-containing protein [Chelatococcus sp.]